MESPFLLDFLKNAGSSVHSINTIIVGLTSIENGKYEKPEDLTITWTTSDNKFSARTARKFALKSALIFIEDSLAIYLKDVRVLTDNDILKSILSRSNPQFDIKLKDTFKSKYPLTFDLFNKQNKKATKPDEKYKEYRHISSADRIRALDEFFDFEQPYWTNCIVLLIRWRNMIVHRKSVGNLTHKELTILSQNSTDIKSNHANIDINETISNFNNNLMTLKDATTLIAIAIRFARSIDEELFKSVDKIEIVESYVKRKKLTNIYNDILSCNNLKIKERKFKNFIKTNISPLDELTIKMLFNESKPIELDIV
jgi:hypothetical protein